MGKKDFVKIVFIVIEVSRWRIGEGEHGSNNHVLFLHTVLWGSFYIKEQVNFCDLTSIVGTSSMDL